MWKYRNKGRNIGVQQLFSLLASCVILQNFGNKMFEVLYIFTPFLFPRQLAGERFDSFPRRLAGKAGKGVKKMILQENLSENCL
jgi:hypothetical protein